MPNLAASVLEGVTALYASAPVPKARRLEAQYMMETIGRVAWVESESQLDAVTAVASSGLAYFFELADALALAARQAGLGGEFSDWLAQQTLRGAGAMMREGGPSPRQLSDAVCSPGGTTAAALGELQPDLAHAVSRAVSAARSKAVALSSA
jgi:pyrroline-5-carboxylate reductase